MPFSGVLGAEPLRNEELEGLEEFLERRLFEVLLAAFHGDEIELAADHEGLTAEVVFAALDEEGECGEAANVEEFGEDELVVGVLVDDPFEESFESGDFMTAREGHRVLGDEEHADAAVLIGGEVDIVGEFFAGVIDFEALLEHLGEGRKGDLAVAGAGEDFFPGAAGWHIGVSVAVEEMHGEEGADHQPETDLFRRCP